MKLDVGSMSEEDILTWVLQTCLLFGAQRSTSLKVTAEFAKAFEKGLIQIQIPKPEAHA